MATKFLGTKRRIEFNGHDVTHLTGMSLGSMGKVYDTYQTLADPFDHDIEITDEASGSFDLIATDTEVGEQKFKEMMQLVNGYVNLDMTTDTAADSVIFTDEDWTDPDTQNSYTGTRFLTTFKRLSYGDSAYVFDNTNDTVWIRFRAMGESIENVAFPWTYNTSGVGTNTIRTTLWTELSFGNVSKGETAALASGGSTTTLVDSGILTAADDSFVGATVKFLSGANAGLTRTVTDSVSSTATLTFAAVPTAVASGDQYMIYGVPSDTSVSGAGDIDIVINGTYNGGVNWKVETAPANWTGLTVGKFYWMKLFRQTHSGAGDAQLRLDATATTMGVDGALWQRNASYTAEGGAAKVADTEALHYIKFKTEEGLNVVVYDYTDNSETNGVKWTFKKVKLDSVTPSFANKQATRASVSWKCNDWSFDAI